MTSRTWIGGGDNLATNGSDWSPTGAPRPWSDKLTMTSGTMNIVGNALWGNPLNVPSGSVDLNLTNASVNLNLGTLGIPQILATAVIGMSGKNTLIYTGADSSGTVNLAPGAQWNGHFSLNYSYVTNPIPGSVLTINGQPGSAFNNTGSSTVGNFVQINADVIGAGNFAFGYNGLLEFMHSVGPGQSVSFPKGSGTLQIDSPTQFSGLVTLGPENSSDFFIHDSIDLKNLATADSYTFKNDMLTIFARGTAIDTLRLNAAGPITVIESASDLWVLGASDRHPPPGTVLPVHV